MSVVNLSSNQQMPIFKQKVSFKNTQNPKVLMIDVEKKYDIDGDGINDCSHGDIVERFIKAYCPKAKIDKIILPKFSNGTTDYNEKDMLETLLNIDKKYDAINISLGNPCHYGIFNNVNPVNLKANSDSIMNLLRKSKYTDDNTSAQTIDKFGDIVNKFKSSIYIALGNAFGFESFNLYNLSDKTINVGGLNGQGDKILSNSLANRWEKAVYNITKVEGGFDLTGDDKPEILDSEVSGKESQAKKFIGRKAQEVIATKEDWDKIEEGDLSSVSNKLFSLGGLFNRELIEEKDYYYLVNLGEFVSINDNKIGEVFRKKNEVIVYDPENSGRTKNIVNCIAGSSFSAPVALGKDLQAKFFK
ncbi:MAG TPA: hypothetical protein P5556_02035 [Candidatus Gastranaerophilales bacterium]|nr:hypothetical protein [Candidatus Gastranaerophilales bacterium]